MSRWLVGSSRTSRSASVDQRRGQRHPPPFAAGQPVDRGVEPDVGQARARTAPPGRPHHRPRRARPCRRRPHPARWRRPATGRPGRRSGSADAPIWLTRPESGGSAPVSIRSSVDLPPPLRPTTPIRSPAATPSDTPLQHRGGAVGLADVFQVDEVLCGHQPAPTHSRSGRRVTTARANRQCPVSAGASASGVLAVARPGTARRPGAADQARQRTAAAARGQGVGQRAGPGSSAAGCRSLRSAAPGPAHPVLPRAASRSASSSRRSVSPAAGSGPAPRTRPAWTGPVRRHASTQCSGGPLERASVARRARPDGQAAVQRERDIAAELGGHRPRSLVAAGTAGRRPPARRRRRPIRRPARPATGICLSTVMRGGLQPASRSAARHARLVPSVGSPSASVRSAPASGRPAVRGDRVVQVDPAKTVCSSMEAVGPSRARPPARVDLGRHPDGDRGRAACCTSARASVGRG